MVTFAGMWAELAEVGRPPSGGCRRFAWTSTDAVLREWFTAQAQARGLDVIGDRAGNLWAWAGDPDAAGVPTAMLFVRNPTGVSHSPAEHADEADCLAGVAAPARVVREPA